MPPLAPLAVNRRSLLIGSPTLTGTFPSAFLGNFSNLASLTMAGTQISGTLPSRIQGLGALTYLSVTNGLLTGTLPRSFEGLAQLTVLDLSGHAIAGTIPSSLTSLTGLTLFRACGNAFQGDQQPWMVYWRSSQRQFTSERWLSVQVG